MASLNESKQHIIKYGLARTNRFNVIITLPIQLQNILNDKKGQSQDDNFLSSLITETGVNLIKSYLGSGTEIIRGLDIMCETAQFPSKSFATSETKYNSDYLNLPYGITYVPIDISFVVSSDFLEKNIIDEWHNMIINPITHEVGYFEDFVAPIIEIQQLNNEDQVTHTVQLKDAYPSEISSMELSNADIDNYHVLTVTFVYRTWSNTDITQPSGVTSLTQTPLGPLVTPILSNPVIQKATDFIEREFDTDLDGEAANIYNQVDDIVRNTTGQSVNKSASLLNGIKASLDVNDSVTNDQKSKLIEIIDGTLGRLV